jgi:hypothetical protein
MIAGVCGYIAELEKKILHGYKCNKCALSLLISEMYYTRVSNKIMNCNCLLVLPLYCWPMYIKSLARSPIPILFQWKIANVTVLMDSKNSVMRKYFKI